MNNPKLRFKREDSTDYPEWKKTKIGKLTKTFSASRVHRVEWQTEGVPFWRSSDVMAFHQHKENAMGKAFITNELYEELSAKSGKMMKDDILITGGGSIGVPYLIPNNEPLYVKDADLLCIQKSDSHYPKFLYQFFWSPSFRNYLSVISHKGTIAHYTITQINETPIMMPCLEEQQKIADFLSAVDEVIAQSEAEVQNLEQQKKAAMQKIFSQEVRFKREDGTDFPEWEETDLNSIGSFYGGLSGKTKENFGKGNSKFVTYMNVYKNVFASQEMLEFVDVSDNEKQNKVQYGDLLMTQSSETVEEVGMSSVYLFRDEPYLNSFCFGLHLHNLDYTNPMYVGYLMRSESIRKQIMSEGQGISRINLSPNRIRGIILPIPCLEEQQKIADFLSAYDEAIRYAKQELDKWKELKKGLLQQMFV